MSKQHHHQQYKHNMDNHFPNKNLVLCSEISSGTGIGNYKVCHSLIRSLTGNFRSAAEAQLDSSSKFRQLPCKTLISIGTCPYGERCVFLHDPRLISNLSHSISRLKNKEDNIVDSFFWPLTSNESSPNKKNDHNFRPYSVPAPKEDQYKLHDQALYSLWMHYVEFCRMSTKTQKSFGAVKMAPQDLPLNIFTQRKRLPVFQLLSSSNGHTISSDQFHFASYERMRSVSDEAINRGDRVVKQQLAMQINTNAFTPAVAAVKSKVPYPAHKTSPTSINTRLSFDATTDMEMRLAAEEAVLFGGGHQQNGYYHNNNNNNKDGTVTPQNMPVFVKKTPPRRRTRSSNSVDHCSEHGSYNESGLTSRNSLSPSDSLDINDHDDDSLSYTEMLQQYHGVEDDLDSVFSADGYRGNCVM